MSEKLILGLPSKGRLMEQAQELFAAAGLAVTKTGARGYRGEIAALPDVDVQFVSSPEIAQHLKTGAVHLGITGEDLVREAMADADQRLVFRRKLGFGPADVVVAVPDWWIDVRVVGDLEIMAMTYRRVHGHRVRVATKYMNLARRFFASKGVTTYRLVESLGATEGAPAAGVADLIVDITTTGATLKANGLRILDDGVILKSEANLISANAAAWSPSLRAVEQDILGRLRP
jgi:ATP phosphoribosyltransferase